jgi:hypothetical protein
MKQAAVIAIALAVGACKQGDAPAASGSAAAKPAAGSGSGSAAAAAGAGSGSAATAAGTGSGSAATTAPPSGKPLRETIAASAKGKPVLLAIDAKGQLIARTVDDSSTQVLLAGPYSDALHDDALDLVWLRRTAAIDVLDLRLPGSPAARTLVTAPDKVLEKLAEHFSEPPHWNMKDSVVINLGDACRQATGLVLDWSKGGIGTATFSEGVKVADKDWFAAQEHRAKQDVPAAFTKKLAKRHKVPKSAGTCHRDIKEELGKDDCGRGLYFGETGGELVIASANAEKCPAKQCRLYDASTKKYAAVPGLDADDPDEHTCGPFLFDRAGTSYLVNDKVCSGSVCTSVGKLAVGWLDGERVLDGN